MGLSVLKINKIQKNISFSGKNVTVFLIKDFGRGSFKITHLLKFCFQSYLNVENCNAEAESCFPFLFWLLYPLKWVK